MRGIATAATAIAFAVGLYATATEYPAGLFPVALFGGLALVGVATMEFRK